MKTKHFCSYYKCIICKDAAKIKLHILKRKFFMMENSDLENITEEHWRVERLLGCVLTSSSVDWLQDLLAKALIPLQLVYL